MAVTDRQFIGLADAYFTLSDEQNGYPETRRRLAGYDDERLLKAYQQAVRDSLGEMFGHNARKFGNLVVDELTARGITEYRDIFGSLQVRRFESMRGRG